MIICLFLCNLYLGYRSQFLGLGSSSQFFDPEFQVLCSGYWILSLRSWVLGFRISATGSCVKGSEFVLPGPFNNHYKLWQEIITKRDRYHKVGQTVIAKWDRKLLQTVTGITKWDKKLLQSVTGIIKSDNYHKVKRNKIAPYFCNVACYHLGTSRFSLKLFWTSLLFFLSVKISFIDFGLISLTVL